MVIPWAIVKSQFSHQQAKAFSANECPWQNKDHFDYIFICPVILVLMINIYFLARIMWVLITKLRAATSVESKQYRNQLNSNKHNVSNHYMKKAAKALLVLIPLLGVTYIVVIVTPAHRTARVVFSYAQALLLSTQGFTVAVLYCFMNGEVQKSVRHHFEQWKDQRGLGNGRRQRCDGSSNADGFRLYPNRGVRDRTSCISLSTSGTWLSTGKSPQSALPRPSNGSYSPVPVKEDAI
ncbi:diuretic hormone receptor [Caerostris extrusa]|uniref:Diuretic hormone receptor n=1 Tax=Caerostris extrusa TaxID=172846 RepID=A0AAV4MID5_CAEEX|nr:diuretic hormone receptor [Caerostris extrusa]